MKKSIVKIGAVALAVGTLFGAGCGKDKVDSSSPETLEVYIFNAGYGYEWCQTLLDAFKEETWVKEKYPNLAVDLTHNEVENYATDMLNGSASTNKYEIIMGLNLYKSLGDAGRAEDLTKTVYETTVPGENVRYIDKMYSSVLRSNLNATSNPAATDTYYTTTWATGMTGIVYNENALQKVGKPVPNTTDELIDIMKYVKSNTISGYDQKYSFVTYTSSAYTNYMLNTWWAQYEGCEEYANFFEGYDSSTNSISSAVLSQEGRLKALEVLESVMSKDKGYVYLNPAPGREAYRTTQNQLVMGKGLFMANGDWFDNEMRSFCEGLQQTQGHCDTIKLMKTPVISSIISQTPSIENDAELSALITAIDAGSKALSGTGYDVEQDDFNRILDARTVVYSIGPGHNAVVPKTAVGKEVAYDFLRFMATDKALALYIEATNGASLPFNYDCKAQNVELYNKLSPMQKDRLDYFDGYQKAIDILPAEYSFPLVFFGGLSAFKSVDGKAGMEFLSGYSKGNYASAAERIFREDIKYWTDEFDRNWNTAVAEAGI